LLRISPKLSGLIRKEETIEPLPCQAIAINFLFKKYTFVKGYAEVIYRITPLPLLVPERLFFLAE
jgi:hypothetical protein